MRELCGRRTFKQRRVGRASITCSRIPPPPLSFPSLSFFFFLHVLYDCPLICPSHFWLLILYLSHPFHSAETSHFFSIPLFDLSISLSSLPFSFFLNFFASYISSCLLKGSITSFSEFSFSFLQSHLHLSFSQLHSRIAFFLTTVFLFFPWPYFCISFKFHFLLSLTS